MVKARECELILYFLVIVFNLFSCGCQHCMVGVQCEDLTQTQNPWKVCQIVPKTIILPPPPLAVPDHVIDNDIGGQSDDENAWDYWEN